MGSRHIWRICRAGNRLSAIQGPKHFNQVGRIYFLVGPDACPDRLFKKRASTLNTQEQQEHTDPCSGGRRTRFRHSGIVVQYYFRNRSDGGHRVWCERLFTRRIIRTHPSQPGSQLQAGSDGRRSIHSGGSHDQGNIELKVGRELFLKFIYCL